MIAAVRTAADRAEFCRRVAGRPYFAAVMGTHLTLYAEKPGSGWQFYLLPGRAALALRGGSATLCGELPKGDALEELAGFLRFLCVDRLVADRAWPMLGAAAPLLLWKLPKGSALPPRPDPTAAYPGLTLDTAPQMQPVSRLVFADSEAEQESFYSAACTALAHGYGVCHALTLDGAPVCTVGSYERSESECYMAAGVTAPQWRGRGLAGYLIVDLANRLAAEQDVTFTSAPHLWDFYTQLGFLQNGQLYDIEK